ncbi:hypothetical protein Mapa_017388 [Marchantia paleacea]|nr:hypothetical protein Mapa_017388 [Marchantia paleacea]
MVTGRLCPRILLALLALFGHSHAFESVSFAIERDFSCGKNMTCMGFAKSGGQGRLHLLGQYEENASGAAVYHERIPVVDLVSKKAASASFRTFFKFSIHPENGTSTGDGMTFAMISNISWVNNSKVVNSYSNDHAFHSGAFGLFNASGGAGNSQTLAIEFDTRKNLAQENSTDADDNHIGIDINSYRSANSSKVPFVLDNTQKNICAWIDYHAPSLRLEVRVSQTNTRPNEAALTHHDLDLYKVFHDEACGGLVWVGFTASNSRAKSKYVVVKWTFSTSWDDWQPDQIAGQPAAQGGPSSSKNHTVLVSVTIPATVGLCAFMIWWICRRIARRRTYVRTTAVSGLTFEFNQPGQYTFKELNAATNGFSEDSKLGQGGFGTVYRGERPSDGSPLAIKKLNDDSSQGKREFMTEIVTITQIRHRNIVQLLGWCEHEGKLLLVYELMPNGSLDRALFAHSESDSDGNETVLSWSRRFRIIRGLASALDYLHEGGTKQVIHRDVKSSNVMLDSMWDAKLGDFGLARTEDHLKIMTTTIAAGTQGYMSPEAAIYGKFTIKSDVYSFGIVGLEVACGRKALDTQLPEEESILVDWVWSCYHRGDLLGAADPRLQGSYDESEMTAVLLLGLLCSNADTHSRPSMRQVTQVLSKESPMLPVPICKSADIAYLSDLPQTHFQALLTSMRASGYDSANRLVDTRIDQ